ncbi:MAG TPA: hypothetical protein VJ921_06985, partial [Vicinamibacteria bacterium]|nr:hypothetical protein [Vicinamibacteria bacterium]
IPYLLTTGSLYRVDAAGELLLDRALQRDALFHLGIARSLETSYPPRLLSVSGEPVGYHSGYHLQLALWSRFFGIESADGLARLAPVWNIALYVFAAYLLARRLFEGERTRQLSAILVLASGFGFAFFFRPSVDWWSLTFMDWALVSIFLANPLLAALPLLFVGLALLHDYEETGSRGSLAAGALSLSFIFLVKMFLGAQALAALFLAALSTRGNGRAWKALCAAAVASSGVVLHTALAAAGSNTDVGFRPLEIVRYSMEKLDWTAAVEALAAVGDFSWPSGRFLLVAFVTLLWFAGFLGLRLLGLRGAFRDVAAGAFLPSAVSWFALIGFPLSLVFRIAPAEAQGLSRLEALNDAGWFATASGILLWFPTARALSALRPLLAGLAILLLALPATAQHFFHAASLGADRIGRSRVEASREAERLSPPQSVWLEPPDRARPSLLAYFAGRPTVYDGYVGYDYMFFGRDEIDYRRHAVAQFWSSTDPAYLAWFLKRFRVGFAWREGRELPSGNLLVPVFDNGEVELSRVDATAVEEALRHPLAVPESIPIGGRGLAYFGAGWSRPEGSSQRRLPPGRAKLYLPLDRAIELDFLVDLEGGGLRVEGSPPIAVAGGRARFAIARSTARGLHAIEVDWSGPSPLAVRGIEIRAGVVP